MLSIAKSDSKHALYNLGYDADHSGLVMETGTGLGFKLIKDTIACILVHTCVYNIIKKTYSFLHFLAPVVVLLSCH